MWNAPVAKWLRRLPSKQKIAGSTPAGGYLNSEIYSFRFIFIYKNCESNHQNYLRLDSAFQIKKNIINSHNIFNSLVPVRAGK
tara:strand:- start:3210 stop:3458 length:249 start_codon:yes stop_codon:yes gene_type:complete